MPLARLVRDSHLTETLAMNKECSDADWGGARCSVKPLEKKSWLQLGGSKPKTFDYKAIDEVKPSEILQAQAADYPRTSPGRPVLQFSLCPCWQQRRGVPSTLCLSSLSTQLGAREPVDACLRSTSFPLACWAATSVDVIASRIL